MTVHHDSPAPAADPDALVGRYIRRRGPQGQPASGWAQIVMTVPSAAGRCWMVTYPDGDVDIWRIDDPTARYQISIGAPRWDEARP